MPWMYEQKTGILRNPVGILVAVGYAGGDKGQCPEGVNNPEMQDDRCQGPLPQGRYSFGKSVDHPHLGPMAIPLIPAEGNEMYGRAGFYMHGDNSKGDHSASEGCIIMPKWARLICDTSPDRELIVVKGD